MEWTADATPMTRAFGVLDVDEGLPEVGTPVEVLQAGSHAALVLPGRGLFI